MKKIEDIVSKAYELNLNKLEEGYMGSQTIVYAEDYNEAKSLMLKEVRYWEWKLKYSGEELTYLNIPIKRCKEMDKVMFEGKPMTRYDIHKLLIKRERFAKLDAILANPDIHHCYIMKRGIYYRPNSRGYTEHITQAGVYSKEEAVRDGKSCLELEIVPIETESHNEKINKVIAELQTRLIPASLTISSINTESK